MDNHNSLMAVIFHNIKHIIESIFSWILVLFGISGSPTLDIANFTDPLIAIELFLRILALTLACSVSIFTLYKIKKDLEKNK